MYIKITKQIKINVVKIVQKYIQIYKEKEDLFNLNNIKNYNFHQYY